MFELQHPRGHQVVHHIHRPFPIRVEEFLHDQDAVVNFTLVLDLLLIGEDVVGEAGVVGCRVLQRTKCPGTEGLGWDPRSPGNAGQVHREVGAERLAAHLDVVDRIGHPMLDAIVELPQPARRHVFDPLAELTALWHGHRGCRAHPQFCQAFLHRVGRWWRGVTIQRHEHRQPGMEHLCGRHVPGGAEDRRKIVITVGPPGQPGRGLVELRTGRVGMEPGRADGEIE